MQIAITGASGFVGRALTAHLLSEGHGVLALGRDESRLASALPPQTRCMRWSPTRAEGAWVEAVRGCDAVIHLAGEPVLAHRWNAAVKASIMDSRVASTRTIVTALSGEGSKVKTLLSSSGIDYYGDTSDRLCDERAPAGDSFLATVCLQWEAEAHKAEAAGVRVVCNRTGIVLGEKGGALEQMELPFKLFVGGPLGSGRQWFAWVHLDDMVGLMDFELRAESLRGAVNAVAPEPLRQADFARALGRVMHRPSWAPVPQFALRIAVGEAASLLTESKRIDPRALRDAGYAWRRPQLDDALRATLG